MITLSTPIPDPLSGHLIQLQHHKLTIEHDLELTQEVRMVFYTNDNGDFGIPLLESIDLNPNLTPEQKARQRQIFQTQRRTVSTRGYYVDATTGELVQPDENGQWPENAIPERELWLNVLASQVPGEKLSDKVFALIVQSMGKMVDRNRI